jgi:hypothetical protein
MLKLARVLLLALLLVFWFLFGLLLCLVRPRHPNNVYVFARMYHAVCPLIGLKVRVTVADEVKSVGPAVYVCNHQSNYDIFTVTGAVQPGVVAVGKKSLLWLPFFGLIFWLSGTAAKLQNLLPRLYLHLLIDPREPALFVDRILLVQVDPRHDIRSILVLLLQDALQVCHLNQLEQLRPVYFPVCLQIIGCLPNRACDQL